jgi:hypothetical protein
MNVRVHIERLVLDDAPPGLDRSVLARVVAAELARLLTEAPPVAGLIDTGAVPTLRGPDITDRAEAAEPLGTQIATAVHAGLRGDPGGGP